MGGVLGTAGARERARPGDGPLEGSVRLQPAQLGVIAERAHDRVAHARPLAGQLGGQDRRRALERQLLHEGQQPPLRDLVRPREQLVNRRVGDGPSPTPAWRTLLHGELLSRSAVAFHGTMGHR